MAHRLDLDKYAIWRKHTRMTFPDWSTPLQGVTIRHSTPNDHAALVRLAALDSQPVPDGPLLLGEVADRLWAAVSLDGKVALADPFQPSAEIVHLLRARARQLQRPRRHAGPRRLRTAPA
jgi:hypothetical protein